MDAYLKYLSFIIDLLLNKNTWLMLFRLKLLLYFDLSERSNIFCYAAFHSNMAEGRMNLAALQQRDPYISEILDTASQVALYSFSSKSNEWVCRQFLHVCCMTCTEFYVLVRNTFS